MLAVAPAALRNRRLVIVDGEPGCGKSTAKDVLAAASPVPVATFTMPSYKSGHGRQFMHRAHEAVAGHPVADLSQRKHEDKLEKLLREEPRLLLIDEAQNAPLEVLRNLRYLLERPGTQFAVALFGTGVVDNIRREQMLHTWTGFTSILRPMLSPQQIQAATIDDEAKLARRAWLLPTLRRWHPRLQSTDPALLVTANYPARTRAATPLGHAARDAAGAQPRWRGVHPRRLRGRAHRYHRRHAHLRRLTSC